MKILGEIEMNILIAYFWNEEISIASNRILLKFEVDNNLWKVTVETN